MVLKTWKMQMDITVSTQDLNNLINKMQNVVAQKATVPILSNVLIEADSSGLIFTATDLTVVIRCRTSGQVVQGGATTLPAKRFAQLIRELTTAQLEISSNSNEVTTIVAGTSRFKLNGMSKKEFPSLPDFSSSFSFRMKQSDLKDMLYRTSFAVSKEDNRYSLTGVLMQISNEVATFVGTDGKRLARAQIAIENPIPFASQSIIPLKAVDEILKNLGDEGEVSISLMADKIAVEADQILILTKLLAGEYPDVERVIPEQTDINIALHREELMCLLRQVSLFIANPNHSVRFSFTPGELKLSATDMEIGEGNVAMPVNYQGPKLDIAFNPKFFLDILNHCKAEVVNLGLTDAYNPGIITDGEGSAHPLSSLFVLMPMRLPEE